MITDRFPDNLYHHIGIDGGDTCRKRVEHRSFSQFSFTSETVEAKPSQRTQSPYFIISQVYSNSLLPVSIYISLPNLALAEVVCDGE